MNVRIAASAAAEFVEAVRWYEDRRQGLGAVFFDAVGAVLSRIEEHPTIGAPFAEGHPIRRVLIVGFPTRSSKRSGPRNWSRWRSRT